MLDHFSIITQGGLVLWSRSFTPAPSPFDSLIREALIEERSSSSSGRSGQVSKWDRDGYSLLWTLANELELVFVVAYQRILQLTYVEELLEAVKRTFLAAYQGTVRAIVDSTKGKDLGSLGLSPTQLRRLLGGREGWAKLFKGWEVTFAKLLRDLELGAAKVRRDTVCGPGDGGADTFRPQNKKTKPKLLVQNDSPSPSSDVSQAQSASRSVY